MKKRPLATVCLIFFIVRSMISVISSGQLQNSLPAASFFEEHTEETCLIKGQVYQKQIKEDQQVYYLKNNSIFYREQWIPCSNIIVYDDSFQQISIGNIITIKGSLKGFEPARNPGNFDQRKHYYRKKIVGMVWCQNIYEISGEPKRVRESLFQVKQKWSKLLEETLGRREGGILSAMLVGEKELLEEEIKELYQKTGIGHTLAISGLHVSFIGWSVYVRMRKTGVPYLLAGGTAALLLTLYGLMVGFSVSVFRAFVMLLLRLGADMTGRVYDGTTSLSIAMAGACLWNPNCIYDFGFWLSYGAIMGILWISPIFKEVKWMRQKWCQGLVTSVSIQIMTFPVILYAYYEIPVYSIFLNLMIIPAMSYVLGVGLVGSGIWIVHGTIGTVVLQSVGVVLKGFEWLAGLWNDLPGSRWITGQPDLWKVIGYYMILALFLFAVKQKNLRKRAIGLGAYVGSVLVLCLHFPEPLEITMLDVGQGDCLFVREPDGVCYMVDGGSSDLEQVGKYRMEPFLKYKGISTVDFVFLSHGDQDHCNGIRELLERQEYGVRIKNLVLPQNYQQDETLCSLVKVAECYGTGVSVFRGGDQIVVGNLIWKCLQPTEEEIGLEGNAGSMVLELQYKGFSMLFTGDVEGKGESHLENRVQKTRYQILKVAHHGSKNSTKASFLDAIHFQVALISSGVDNTYGHPHKELIERLEASGSRIYQTREHGAISIWVGEDRFQISEYLNSRTGPASENH